MSLLLATAIWFLIRDYLKDNGEYYDRSEEEQSGEYKETEKPPKALPVPKSEQPR